MVFLYVKTREWQARCRDSVHSYCEACREMARRRQEIALQTEIETQEEWTEALNKEGLTGNGSSAFEAGIRRRHGLVSHASRTVSFSVIDIYQQWTGPCRSVEAIFKQMSQENGDRVLKLAAVIIRLPLSSTYNPPTVVSFSMAPPPA